MKFNIIFLIIYFFSINVFSQESLESILSEIDDSESSSAVTSTFKSTRIINGHSVELVSPKSLEFRNFSCVYFSFRPVDFFVTTKINWLRI